MPIDLLSMADTTMQGSGVHLVNTTDGVFLEIDRKTSGSGNVKCPQEEVELWLKLSSHFFQGMNILIVLDNCAASKDMKGPTGQLVSLGFSACHAGISVWILTQITSIAKPFCKNVAAIVLFYTLSEKP